MIFCSRIIFLFFFFSFTLCWNVQNLLSHKQLQVEMVWQILSWKCWYSQFILKWIGCCRNKIQSQYVAPLRCLSKSFEALRLRVFFISAFGCTVFQMPNINVYLRVYVDIINLFLIYLMSGPWLRVFHSNTLTLCVCVSHKCLGTTVKCIYKYFYEIVCTAIVGQQTMVPKIRRREKKQRCTWKYTQWNRRPKMSAKMWRNFKFAWKWRVLRMAYASFAYLLTHVSQIE